MTFKVLTEDTKIVIYRSRIRLEDTGGNRRIDGESEEMDNDAITREDMDGENTDLSIQGVGNEQDEPPDASREVVQNHSKAPHEIVQGDKDRPMAQVDVDELVGQTYLTAPAEDRSRTRMKIVEQIDVTGRDAAKSDEMIRFHSQNLDATVEEVIAYNKLIE